MLRALATSRVNELAAPHTIERHHADVEQAERNRREAEERLADIGEQRAATSRLRRKARTALDERASGLERQLEAAAEELAERRHVASLPHLTRARDPLTDLVVPPAPQLDLGPELTPAPDVGLDLGP